MTAKPLAWLFSDLGIQQSLSRPHVANDNPHAEASFKTLKYHPAYPDRFDSLSHAQTWMRDFERWCCHEHHHTALGLMTPAAVHFGQAEDLWLKRQAVLQAAYQAHPERFSRGQPIPRRAGPIRSESTPPRPCNSQESAYRTTLNFRYPCPKTLTLLAKCSGGQCGKGRLFC